MAQGHVKWFSSEKGYGFIERDGEEDVFVHHSQITMDGFRTLDAGEPVEFEIIAGDRGPKARNVLRADQPSGASSKGQANGHRNGSSTTTATLGLVGQIRERLFGRLTKHA
jgi:CspA family cold shock protein